MREGESERETVCERGGDGGRGGEGRTWARCGCRAVLFGVVVWCEPAVLCVCVCVCLWSAVHSFTAQSCCVSRACWLTTYPPGSVPPLRSPSPCRPPPSLLCPALPCPTAPHLSRLATAQFHSLLAVVTLLAFLLSGLWLAGPLGSQPKAPKLTPIQTRGQDAKGACATLRVRGPS